MVPRGREAGVLPTAARERWVGAARLLAPAGSQAGRSVTKVPSARARRSGDTGLSRKSVRSARRAVRSGGRRAPLLSAVARADIETERRWRRHTSRRWKYWRPRWPGSGPRPDVRPPAMHRLPRGPSGSRSRPHRCWRPRSNVGPWVCGPSAVRSGRCTRGRDGCSACTASWCVSSLAGWLAGWARDWGSQISVVAAPTAPCCDPFPTLRSALLRSGGGT